MTHLVIQLKKVLEGGSRESVTSAFIKKLYDYTSDANLVYLSTDLKGDLSVDKTYLKYIDYLTTKYPGLDILATSTYIYFGDNAVESYWANTAYGDGIGITSSSAATITKISNSPFYNNTNITNLDGMLYFINCTDIGGRFAQGATGLTSFVAPLNLLVLSDPYDSDPAFMGAFKGCTTLSHVVLNEGLLKITCCAFLSCTSLQTIDIPSTVTHLATNDTITKGSYGVFAGCTSLTTVTGGEGIIKMGSSIFSGCSSLLSLPDINFSQMTYVGESCFKECLNLELGSVNLLNITTLWNGTFYNCKRLTSLNISNVTEIKDVPNWLNEGACRGCTSLTTITTGLNLLKIGSYAFYGCTNLLTIGYVACTTIGEGAFSGCTSLSSIDFSNVTTFGSACFKDCTSLGVGQDLDMDLDGKSFGANVFRGTGYRSITLHETTKHKISDFAGSGQADAFGTYMNNLVKFDLSDTKLTNIEALYSSNLVTLILPETYTASLSKGRDWGTSLLYVVCLSTNPIADMKPNSYWGFVLMPNDFAIYVPDSAYNDYVDVFITNSSDPIPSSRLKKISELPSSVTWYTKEHPST